ncbi:uncharacterized protein FOMMEDRAFT_58262, partial [Fomitiporia mediterranea MF3/22]|uniref:uncharacterized protein n=1 Tax=Fomitiporia mediterranea (strain MF3/22) TaxID=694068 RepID=UPI0004409065
MLPPRAYIFIGLNVIRVLSIIGLILVFSSSILVMVDDIKAVNRFVSAAQTTGSNSTVTDSMLDCDYIEGSTVPNQPAGVFWAVVNRLMIIFQVVILFLSEIGWPYKFFDRFFPVLGTNFGLGAIGLFQCFIGAAVLSHHVDDFALVSAFFLFAIGCLNILIGLIFREKGKAKRSITSWRAEKKKGILPMVTDRIGERAGPLRPMFTGQPPSFLSNHLTGNSHPDNSSEITLTDEKRGYGWGRQAEKKLAGAKGILISKPVEALPPYGP